MVHLISESELLFFGDMPLHIIIEDLVLQGAASISDVDVFVDVLVISSLGVFDWEWVNVAVLCVGVTSVVL